MLTAAIMRIMDLSEVVIFVNTSNSVPILENTISGAKECTLSPWIYEEVLLTEILRKREWFEHRTSILNKRFELDREQRLKLHMNFLRII